MISPAVAESINVANRETFRRPGASRSAVAQPVPPLFARGVWLGLAFSLPLYGLVAAALWYALG